jgi:hypothetical protein
MQTITRMLSVGERRGLIFPLHHKSEVLVGAGHSSADGSLETSGVHLVKQPPTFTVSCGCKPSTNSTPDERRSVPLLCPQSPRYARYRAPCVRVRRGFRSPDPCARCSQGRRQTRQRLTVTPLGLRTNAENDELALSALHVDRADHALDTAWS